MKEKNPVLTKEERDILILCAAHLGAKKLSNSEVAEQLGISVIRVKRLMHHAFKKLEVNNRTAAVRSAMIRGEIKVNEVFSLDELADLLSSLGPDRLRRIAYLVHQWLEYGQFPRNNEQIIRTDIVQNTLLTNRERDVIVCVGLGLTNKEIADRLFISVGAVETFLNRACRKLGANNRIDVLVLALKQREISISKYFTLNEVIQILAPLGSDGIEEMARMLDQKSGQEPNPTVS